MILPVDGSQFSLWYVCVLLCCSGVETFCSRPFFRSYFEFFFNDALIAPCCKQLVLGQCDVNQCAAQEGICRHVDVLLWPGPARTLLMEQYLSLTVHHLGPDHLPCCL